MVNGHVITLNVNGKAAYVTDQAWDGGWFTHRREEAKVYKRAANAQKRIAAHNWREYSPQVQPIA